MLTLQYSNPAFTNMTLSFPCPLAFPEDKSLFSCINGQYLPHGLQCDGIKHCEDGSDEIQLCGNSHSYAFVSSHLSRDQTGGTTA